MTDADDVERARREINQKIYEIGETERELERTALFFRHDGWFARLLRWAATRAKRDREDLVRERDALSLPSNARDIREDVE